MNLTDEQIDNWRRVLAQVIGPYALIMPKEQIQDYRDRLQRELEADRVLQPPDAGAPETEG